MSILPCAVCAVEFTAKSSRSKYCSTPCKDKGKPSAGLTCALCAGAMYSSSTSKPQGQAMHNKCRVSLPGVGSHGIGGYAKGCRCAVCKMAKNASMREYNARRTERDGVSPTSALKRRRRGVDPLAAWDCTVCKEPMRHAARTESPTHKECRIRRTPGLLHKRFQAKIDKAARGTTGGNRVFVNGGCAWCAETFTAAAGVYCSEKCKVSAGFKRRSGGKSFTVSPRVRLAIYERDSWDCQLCARPVDSSLHHRDNWSASLDHIIPQSHMLIPDHSPSNLRLVHKMCNSMRGDGSNMTEVEFHRRINDHFEGVAA